MLKHIKKLNIVILSITVMAIIAFTSNMFGKNTQPIFESNASQLAA